MQDQLLWAPIANENQVSALLLEKSCKRSMGEADGGDGNGSSKNKTATTISLIVKRLEERT